MPSDATILVLIIGTHNSGRNNPLRPGPATDCWIHVHLSAERGERSSTQFKGDAWPGRRILQVSSYPYSLRYWVGTEPMH